jgi:hypothetical protein
MVGAYLRICIVDLSRFKYVNIYKNKYHNMKIKNQLAIFIVLMIIWFLINNSFKLEVIGVGFILSLVIAFIFGRRTDVLNEFKFTPAAFYYSVSLIIT